MAEFTEPIFMGAGSSGHTQKECKRLHSRLDDGLSWHSGLQQLATQPAVFEPAQPDEFAKGDDAIMDVVTDIATALGCEVRRMDDEMRYILEIERKRLGV
jgi:hypothetical protein